ncbi:MAG: dTDP-glucose 4,6-dehydratase [Gemmataceae bacterium]
MKRILVTGGCGFIGSNFIRFMLANRSDVSVVNLDRLTYAGNLGNLEDLPDRRRYQFVHGDVAERDLVRDLVRDVQAIFHFAAESHVDRSIFDASPFVHTNVRGTQVLLDAAREFGVERFIQVSTDEVYGSLGPSGSFTEESPIAPNSPYAASKAAADLLVRSYIHTFGLPAIITRCCNNYGPYQFPEKLIPLFIVNLLQDQPVPLYGDGLNIRDWIHVQDHCAALELVWRRGRPGQVYNIGARCERTNWQITRMLLHLLNKPESLVRLGPDRPGHDRRYAIDPSKIEQELGWRPAIPFEQGLQQTVEWYRTHMDWVRSVCSGEYRTYYERQYGRRLMQDVFPS